MTPPRGRPWKSRRCIPTVLKVRTDRPNNTDARPLYIRGHRNMTAYNATRWDTGLTITRDAECRKPKWY
jgi:hypothetical protein